MAFFKFRWPGHSEQQAEKPGRRSKAAQGETVEAMRRRARHRLIGAAVLVLVGVIGFPLLFDTQPRPIPVDIPIEIPDRNRVAPLVVPAAAPHAAPAANGAVASATPTLSADNSAAPRTGASAGITDGEEIVPTAKPVPSKATAAPVPVPVPVPTPAAKPEPKPAPAPAPVPEPKPARTDDARARALLEGRAEPSHASADEGRYIVQVGAFADADKAREARSRLERAGLKTYTQVVDTREGKRTRVRVGPFASRAEADKAAARIRSLDLSASVLTL